MSRIIVAFLFSVLFLSCDDFGQNTLYGDEKPEIKVVSKMKDVMWDGKLYGKIRLDTIQNREGLYGIGPLAYLSGEITILDGRIYVSKVTNDGNMQVFEDAEVEAPFFVYSNVTQWKQSPLPEEVRSMDDIEQFLNLKAAESKLPFAFKVKGNVSTATIHVQNLPEGATVSSPKEAHQGQVKYSVQNQDVELIGFFSRYHEGIFTHHDTYIHVHLITADRTMMGHVDELMFDEGQVILYVPD